MTEKRVLCTIGFSQKNLRAFVGLLQQAGVTKVVDIRLHNTSQLAGYAKKDDLEFVLEILGIKSEHVPDLAPTEELFQRYKKLDKDWSAFAPAFQAVLAERQAARLWDTPVFDEGVNCLLCSEHPPTHCHRWLVAEHLAAAHPEIEIRHLM